MTARAPPPRDITRPRDDPSRSSGARSARRGAGEHPARLVVQNTPTVAAAKYPAQIFQSRARSTANWPESSGLPNGEATILAFDSQRAPRAVDARRRRAYTTLAMSATPTEHANGRRHVRVSTTRLRRLPGAAPLPSPLASSVPARRVFQPLVHPPHALHELVSPRERPVKPASPPVAPIIILVVLLRRPKHVQVDHLCLDGPGRFLGVGRAAPPPPPRAAPARRRRWRTCTASRRPKTSHPRAWDRSGASRRSTTSRTILAKGRAQNLHARAVARAARAHLTVRRVCDVAAAVSGGGGEDAVDDVEGTLHAPETPPRRWRRRAAARRGCGEVRGLVLGAVEVAEIVEHVAPEGDAHAEEGEVDEGGAAGDVRGGGGFGVFLGGVDRAEDGAGRAGPRGGRGETEATEAGCARPAKEARTGARREGGRRGGRAREEEARDIATVATEVSRARGRVRAAARWRRSSSRTTCRRRRGASRVFVVADLRTHPIPAASVPTTS